MDYSQLLTYNTFHPCESFPGRGLDGWKLRLTKDSLNILCQNMGFPIAPWLTSGPGIWGNFVERTGIDRFGYDLGLNRTVLPENSTFSANAGQEENQLPSMVKDETSAMRSETAAAKGFVPTEYIRDTVKSFGDGLARDLKDRGQFENPGQKENFLSLARERLPGNIDLQLSPQKQVIKPQSQDSNQGTDDIPIQASVAIGQELQMPWKPNTGSTWGLGNKNADLHIPPQPPKPNSAEIISKNDSFALLTWGLRKQIKAQDAQEIRNTIAHSLATEEVADKNDLQIHPTEDAQKPRNATRKPSPGSALLTWGLPKILSLKIPLPKQAPKIENPQNSDTSFSSLTWGLTNKKRNSKIQNPKPILAQKLPETVLNHGDITRSSLEPHATIALSENPPPSQNSGTSERAPSESENISHQTIPK